MWRRAVAARFRGRYEISWRGVTESFFIRLRSVFGCSPRMRAAPPAPSITPVRPAQHARDVPRSTSCRVPETAALRSARRGGRPPPRRLGPDARIAARSIDVLELAHVARPGVGRAAAPCCVRRRRSIALAELASRSVARKCCDEQRDVVARARAAAACAIGNDVRAGRRGRCAEAPLRDRRLQVAVGRGDDADVDADSVARRRPARTPAPGARAGAWPAVSSGSSPISSRKIVPPSASSKRPGARRRRAPVNAPRSCPKSSLSTRSAGIAPQLTLTSGRCVRRVLRLVDRARDELLAGARLAAGSAPSSRSGATRSTRASAARSAGPLPMISSKLCWERISSWR